LAGNWRGFFSHKNGAGACMALLVFFGIFIIRSFNGLLGSLIIALAIPFLIFTQSKSPIALLPVILIVSALFVWLRDPVTKFIVAAIVPVTIGILTIGSVEFGPIGNIVATLMSDPTFTGRTEIWRFALDHIAERPIVGFGYQAFWGTSE